MIFNISGGGGAALNFRVVGGTTQPGNPAENCIWVNTDTPIPSWIFSAEEPSPAEAGMVWIKTGGASASAFNALKKNGILVYPMMVYQYIGGIWEDKTAAAKIYQGGEWADVSGELRLYKNGQTFDDVTGGWNTFGASQGWSAGTYSMDETCITITSPYPQCICLAAVNKIDLTDYNTARVDGSVTASGNNHRRGIAVFENPFTGWNPGLGTGVPTCVSYADFGADLDISSLSGEYYVGVFFASATATITKIALNP